VDTLIGKHPVYPSFNGLIDEVEIFNRALSQAEIQAIYNAGSAGKCRSCTAPPSGMVSWWGGDNNALDMVGTNNGTLVNGTTYAPGKVTQALSFDGMDDYVSIPNGIIPHTARNFTVDVWVYAESINGSGENHIVYSGPSGGGEYYLANRNGNFEFAIYTDSGWYRVGVAGETGVWKHLTGLRRGTQIEIWVDGVLRNSLAVPDSDLVTGPNVHSSIGSYNRGQYGFWDGLIDEVAIFSRALSPEEIATISAAGSAGKCIPTCVQPPSGMVSWWKGEDNANDFTGGNNGALVNSPTFADGRVGRAFNFGGDGDYVQVLSPVGLPVGNSPRTMMLWFKTPSAWGDTYQVVIQYGGNTAGSKFGLYIPDYWSRTLSFWGEGSDFAGSTPLQLDTWYHGAVSYDGSVRRLYLNGQYETSLAQSLNTQMNSGGFTIGRTSSSDNITSQWNGLVDEAAIFDRALSAEEIAAIYAAGSAGICFVPDTDLTNIYVSKDNWCNGHNNCWPNIQNGIAAVLGPSIIEITQETYDEDIVLNVDEDITLEGGWDTNFSSCSSYTTINGSMTITHGTIIIENIILK
jgi:hypothetical protein